MGLLSLKWKSDADDIFRKSSVDVRAGGVPSKVKLCRSNDGAEFFVMGNSGACTGSTV